MNAVLSMAVLWLQKCDCGSLMWQAAIGQKDSWITLWMPIVIPGNLTIFSFLGHYVNNVDFVTGAITLHIP